MRCVTRNEANTELDWVVSVSAVTYFCPWKCRTTCMSWFSVHCWVSRRYNGRPNAGYVKKWVTWLSIFLVIHYVSTLSIVNPSAGCSAFMASLTSVSLHGCLAFCGVRLSCSLPWTYYCKRLTLNAQFVRKKAGFHGQVIQNDNLSGRRRVFTDKIHSVRQRLSGITVGPTKDAVCYEEWCSTELDWVEQTVYRDLEYIIECQVDMMSGQMQVMWKSG